MALLNLVLISYVVSSLYLFLFRRDLVKQFLGTHFLAEYYLHLIVFILFPFALISWRSVKRKRHPILFVHGYMHASYVWLYHLYLLRKKGFGPLYTINLGYPFRSIEEYAKKVEKKILAIAKKYPGKPLSLVSHSMGGLVCLEAVLQKNCSDYVDKIIMVGCPIKGTKVADLAIGKCGKQMRVSSEFLQNLQEKIEKERSIALFYVGSDEDQIVPIESCFLGVDQNKELRVTGMGHLGLLASKKVNGCIASFLEKDSQ